VNRLLYIGDGEFGMTSEMRARALSDLGWRVLPPRRPSLPAAWLAGKLESLFYKLRRPLDRGGDNRHILDRAGEVDVIWIDKGNHIRPATLRAVRRLPTPPIVIGYSPDDMAARHNNSAWFIECLPLYDGFITTKSYGVQELSALGCRNVVFVDNAYDPLQHRPILQGDGSPIPFETDVGFVGSYERDRAEMIEFLARAGIPITIRGNGWESVAGRQIPGITILPALYGTDYARAISATRINLTFLRKMNRDLQTTRSIEIPACGGFMLAERSDEHARLFRDKVEAVFFDQPADLLEKTRFYLDHEAERAAIAAAGRTRCIASDYSYAARLRAAIEALGFGDRIPSASPLVVS
jgi:spore maturation protein CgeB